MSQLVKKEIDIFKGLILCIDREIKDRFKNVNKSSLLENNFDNKDVLKQLKSNNFTR